MKTLPLLALALVLTSCATTTSNFPQPDPRWQTFTGQLQYSTPERSVVGEFSAARFGEDFRLEFTKGGAFPLLKLAKSGDQLHAEGPLARGRWQGRADAAPAHLRSWAAVPAAFAAAKDPSARPIIVAGAAGDKITLRLNP